MANRTKLTAKKQKQALEIVAKTGSARKAAKAVGVAFQTIYQRAESDHEFGRAYKLAMREYLTVLEQEADRRALDGLRVPVGFYKGSPSAYVRQYSDTLMIVRLKAIAPEKYRENSKVEHSGPNDGPIAIKSVDGFDWSKYATIFGSVGHVAGNAHANGVSEPVDPAHANGKAGSVS